MQRRTMIIFLVVAVSSFTIATARHLDKRKELIQDPLVLNRTNLELRTSPLEYRFFTKLDAIRKDLLVWQETKLMKDLAATRTQCLTDVKNLIEKCYLEYSSDNNLIIEMVREAHSVSTERTFGCCAIWQYHKCVVRAIRPFARFRFCDMDILNEADEEIEEIVDEHMTDGRICPNYHIESEYCDGVWSYTPFSFSLQVVLFFGALALLISIGLVTYTFYRFFSSPRVIYIAAGRKLGPGDMVELMER